MAIISRCCQLTLEFRLTSPTQGSSLTYLKIATAQYGSPPTAAYIVAGLTAVWRVTPNLMVYRSEISTACLKIVKDVCGWEHDYTASINSRLPQQGWRPRS